MIGYLKHALFFTAFHHISKICPASRADVQLVFIPANGKMTLSFPQTFDLRFCLSRSSFLFRSCVCILSTSTTIESESECTDSHLVFPC